MAWTKDTSGILRDEAGMSPADHAEAAAKLVGTTWDTGCGNHWTVEASAGERVYVRQVFPLPGGHRSFWHYSSVNGRQLS